jgi:hypothetical protein
LIRRPRESIRAARIPPSVAFSARDGILAAQVGAESPDGTMEGVSELPHVRPEAPAAPAPGTRRPLAAVELGSFACGLFAFVTLAIWGFATGDFPWNLVYGIGAPLAALLVWALFVSPRAVFAVHPFIRAIVELAVYASATVAWWSLGQLWIGLVFAVVAVTLGLLSGRRRLG